MTDTPRPQLKFIQIAASEKELYGLDEDGKVYVYKKANDERYAFWAPLTSYTTSRTKNK